MENMILEFEHVTGKGRGFRLQDIHFALPAGYICGLAGSNGAGKTTLLSYIVDSHVKYEGTIRIGGEDIKKNHAHIRNYIGFVSEENSFLEDLLPGTNAELLGAFYENFDMAVFREIMKELAVPMGAPYGKMSRGEKLKFQMAFAMAHKPKIYLLDEVTVGMDPVFRMDFFKILQKVIQDEQASVLMTSHIMSEIERKTDYVGIIEQGRLVQYGESLDIVERLKNRRKEG